MFIHGRRIFEDALGHTLVLLSSRCAVSLGIRYTEVERSDDNIVLGYGCWRDDCCCEKERISLYKCKPSS